MRYNKSSSPPSPPSSLCFQLPLSLTPPSSQCSYPPSSPPACPSPVTVPSTLRRAPSSAGSFPPSDGESSESFLRDRLRSYSNTSTKFFLDPVACRELLTRLDRLPHEDPLYGLKYTYHADTSTFVTKCAPSSGHDAFHPFFSDCLQTMIYERHLTPSQTRAFKLTAGSDVRNFHDGYAGSLKRADILLTPRPDEQEDDNNDDMDDVSEVDVAATLPNGGFPTVAVEVGFSQSYDSLLRDMRLWLEGSDGNVRVVILVNLIETPQVNLQPLVHDQTRTRKRLIYESRFGPVHYKSHRVVGDITGTLELWRLDPVTKLPVVKLRKTVLPPPLAFVLPEEDRFTLSMLDIFGTPDRVPTQCQPDEVVPFPLETYRHEIAAAVKMLVGHRLDDVKCQKAKLVGDDLKDKNWTK